MTKNRRKKPSMAASPRAGLGHTVFAAPLTVPRGEGAGAEIARELAPDYALTVWQTLESVLKWAAEPPALRTDLFEPCSMKDWESSLLIEHWEPELRQPLAVLVGELGNLHQAKPASIAHGCLVVTEWALEHGAVATALAFAEAAALAWPASARYAWMAARLLESHGRRAEAEVWLKRAVRVGADAQDVEAHAMASASLGHLYFEQGDYSRAHRVLHGALRVARKHKLGGREGGILHDLAVVATKTGELDTAERLASEAFDIYRDHDPARLPALASDVAALWMERGKFATALYVLRELPAFIIDGMDERARAHAMMARAAAACGFEPFFDQGRMDALSLVDRSGGEAAAPVCLELALGASSLRRWDEAEQALFRAQETENADLRVRVAAALEAVAVRRGADRMRDPEDGIIVPCNDSLASRLRGCLHGTGTA